MKNLANCSPREFLVQTNKIRKSVERWLTLTDILNIRKTLPQVDADASESDKKKAVENQVRMNLNKILDACLEEHPEETAELLGLLCFIEPEDLDNHKMTELFASFSEIMDSPEVIGFFTSLARLGLTNTSAGANR